MKNGFKSLQAGFSLVEMLVAIGIVLILAVLAVGGVSRMLQSAQRAHCLSNLRQWGVAVNLFVADHDDTFPLSFPYNDGRAWYNAGYSLVTDYILNGPNDAEGQRRWNLGLGINGCPAHADNKVKTNPPKLYSSYSYNFHLGQPSPAASGAGGYFGKRSRIKNPANVLMIVDAPTNMEVSGFSRFTPERIGKCHDGHFNAVYVDGHVESRAEVDPKQIFPE